MTPQQAFDRIWMHFVVGRNPPGKRPTSVKCSYSAKCAIGILFPERDRVLLDRGRPLSYFLARALDGASELSKEGDAVFLEGNNSKCERERLFSFLIAVRSAHDGAAKENSASDGFHAVFERKMRSLANEHGLVVPAT